MKPYNPVVLCIMDGWGVRSARDHNAVSQANTPNFDSIEARYPSMLLAASGEAVGLPDGQAGNSEVGHLTIGAGRKITQDLPRIHRACTDGSLISNPKLVSYLDRIKAKKGAVHIIGLVSQGGVHSHQDHILTLAEIAAQKDMPIWLHIITDGRDTLPKQAKTALPLFLEALPSIVKIASVTGRYFAMDRDNRWERTDAFLQLLAGGNALYQAADPLAALQAGYARNESDEFISPSCIEGYKGMADNDGLLIANFRVDRIKQILYALYLPEQTKCTIDNLPIALPFSQQSLSLTPIDNRLSDCITHLFSPPDLSLGLGECVAQAGLLQLRLAETEKYPHVTYFFNGGIEMQFAGESRHLIPSPHVATYDLQPEMSADQILDTALDAINNQPYHLIIINFANPDMVGHTGDLEAAKIAVQTVDRAIGKLEQAIINKNGAMIITADHGNCEVMWDSQAQQPHTAHTTNLVPCILVTKDAVNITDRDDASLSDLAPTLLELLDLNIPSVMSGKSLLAE